MTTRRHFIKKIGGAIGAGTFLFATESVQDISRALASIQVPQVHLPGTEIAKFVDVLPTFAGQRVRDASYTVSSQEFQQKVLPDAFYAGLKPPYWQGTYLWGYKVGDRPVSAPGHTVEAFRYRPTTVRYVNNLLSPVQSQLEPYLTVDQTLHWADPLKRGESYTKASYKGPIPTSIHLHGAEVPSEFDGTPEQWFTANGLHGEGYATLIPTDDNSTIYRYPNAQEATTLWFHDHTLGITRLTVFAGLAAFYILRDQYDTGLPDNALGLPSGQQEVELALQDKMFDTNRQVLFPDGYPSGLAGPPLNPSVHPYWIPGYVGDVIVVNGKTWPYLNVEPRRYRFRFLNAANCRFFKMRLVDAESGAAGPVFWQIGTDGGLLDRPIRLDDTKHPLYLAPGERADTIVDFTNFAGRSFTLKNDEGTSDTDPASQIMQFRVHLPLSHTDTTSNPAQGGSLRGGPHQEPSIVRLVNPLTGKLAPEVKPSVKRQLALIEADDSKGRILEFLLNNTRWNGIREGTTTPIPGSRLATRGPKVFLTEAPEVGATEVWEVMNLTAFSHSIHLHLLQFQLLNRQNFDVGKYRKEYDSQFPGGVYIPAYGQPSLYNVPNAAGALGGNPDVGPYLQGEAVPPPANEAGWKDTVKMFPGQVTRIVARWAPLDVLVNAVKPGQNLYPFDPTVGGYVWHCHILDHEDNEMMRPYALIWRRQIKEMREL